MAKTNSFDEMVKSILALILLFVLYTWSTRVLHLNVFLLDAELFNFFILYLPSLIFFSSLFLEPKDVFKEVERLIVYSLTPVFAFVIGWYGYSFHYGFVVSYLLSNLVKPNLKKRYVIIIFNGIALLILLWWRSR
ncbi:MAG: hypothetical protein WHS64_01335 [Fervidobacterium sp.]|uniref:Uncharacterized protein n=1 Tax=Fervidobacterium gondwanense DSM 13020 TaxID=1121883 RepID=A0A1M7RZ70_FERGO|nr:hypothetical protein [Fervidobacterium gondwanense]UXF00147.1 hypothetical protein IB67_00675 [Fervidobacterium riparium]SHN51583.1 hypothetical protein SAMN02745226_00362 [Fervidobacterium gondwanense DSM 13020]